MARNRGRCELPGFETAKREEQYEELQKTFKRVFQSADGKIAVSYTHLTLPTKLEV